jgi:hypothetical protein
MAKPSLLIGFLTLMLIHTNALAGSAAWKTLLNCGKELGIVFDTGQLAPIKLAPPKNGQYYEALLDSVGRSWGIAFDDGVGFEFTAKGVMKYGYLEEAKTIKTSSIDYKWYRINLVTPGVQVVDDVTKNLPSGKWLRSCISLEVTIADSERIAGFTVNNILRDVKDGSCDIKPAIVKPLRENVLMAHYLRTIRDAVNWKIVNLESRFVAARCAHSANQLYGSIDIRYPRLVRFDSFEEFKKSITVKKEFNHCFDISGKYQSRYELYCSQIKSFEKRHDEMVATRLGLVTAACNSPDLPQSFKEWTDDTEKLLFQYQKTADENIKWLKAFCKEPDPNPLTDAQKSKLRKEAVAEDGSKGSIPQLKPLQKKPKIPSSPSIH